MIFEVPRSRRIFPAINFQFSSYPDLFHQRFPFFLDFGPPNSDKNWKCFEKNHIFYKKTKPQDPFQMKDLEISHLLVLWIPLYDQIWPIWWRKRVKNLSKWRFPTVPDSSQGFTEASRRFPILLEGLRWCPKVPSLLPRRCMLRKNWSPSVEKKVITECREKSACQERSAEVRLFSYKNGYW